MRAKEDQIADPRVEPAAETNPKTACQATQNDQSGGERRQLRQPKRQGRPRNCAQERRHTMKPGTLQVRIQGMDGEDLVHDKAEVPQQDENLHKGRDVEHDGQRHEQNVEQRERGAQKIPATVGPHLFGKNRERPQIIDSLHDWVVHHLQIAAGPPGKRGQPFGMAPSLPDFMPERLRKAKLYAPAKRNGVVSGLRDGPRIFRNANGMRREPDQPFGADGKRRAAPHAGGQRHFG